MSTFSIECNELFSSTNFYEVLNIPKEATAADVKKAYYKLSLKVHPDRADCDNRLATRKFQTLSKIYAILSDKEKRAVYDETGEIDDEETPERDWNDYWRLLFKKITVEDIEKFKKGYQGSKEEIADVKEAYKRFEGDMDKIMECVPCFELEDEPRIRQILLNLIKEKVIPKYRAFTNEKAQKRLKRTNRFTKEVAEAEALQKKMGIGTFNDLRSTIMKKQEERKEGMDNFLQQLEAKYSKKKPSGKRSLRKADENSESSDSDEKSRSKRPKKIIKSTNVSKSKRSRK
ncbi:DnaJ sub C member 9 [Chamberlinius hualienensis]